MTDFTQAGQTAKALASLFSGQTAITYLTVGPYTTTTTQVAVAHGLSGTPDFVLMSSPDENADLSWSANATTLTITQETAPGNGAGPVSVIAGNLA